MSVGARAPYDRWRDDHGSPIPDGAPGDVDLPHPGVVPLVLPAPALDELHATAVNDLTDRVEIRLSAIAPGGGDGGQSGGEGR